MSIQVMTPGNLPSLAIDDFHFVPERQNYPSVGLDGSQNFFVTWHLKQHSTGNQADSPNDIVAWRVQTPNGEGHSIVAQYYQADGTSVGDRFPVQSFRDLLQHASRNGAARIFYCSTLS